MIGVVVKFTINGLKVFTEGEIKNKPIIFVHGFPYDHKMWDNQIEVLKDNFYCITYDIRGLGQSYIGDGQYTMEAYVWDLFSIMDELKIEKPILCGLSMGGYISFRAVEVEQERFSGLILCDTKSESDNNKGKLIRSNKINKINVDGVGSFANEFVPTCFHPDAPENLSETYNRILNIAKNQNPVGVKGALLAMVSRINTTKSLKKIKIPTLVLAGEEDALTPPKSMKKLSKKIKNSEFHIVPNSGHMTPLENPEFVNEKIKGFLTNNFSQA
jgi:3-oxoadipate enol-lactonase